MEEQRFPISARVIGVMHKQKSKMFMTSVLWSDQNEIIIYRTCQDFKIMHKQMKKAFPANKLRKSDRIIPKFRDRRAEKRDQRKSLTKSLQCLEVLQKYCDKLLSCDSRVCQSAELIQFFHPKDQDLQPDFAKNGVLVMPTAEVSAGAQHGNSSGSVTQPFIMETYRCVAPYETKDTKNKPFKVAVDENVDVLIKDKTGWWLVEKEDKRLAWFPAPYLERLDDDCDCESENEDDTNGTFERGMLYTAVKSYTSTKNDEINVPIGAVVQVLEKSNNGWWIISYNGKAGYVPAMYLQPYNYPHIRMANWLQDHPTTSKLELQTPDSLGLQQSHQLSRSQGNLLQLPPGRSPTPGLHQTAARQRSSSLTILSEQPPARPAATTPATKCAGIPASGKQAPPPSIRVELDADKEHGRTQSEGGEGSLGSDGSSDSIFSFRDDLSVSSGSSWLKLSLGANDERLILSRTPPPTVSTHLSPTDCPESKMTPSVSDPSLYKVPKSPKVPPRPRAFEILTRCSTLTRKKATSGNLSPSQAETVCQ